MSLKLQEKHVPRSFAYIRQWPGSSLVKTLPKWVCRVYGIYGTYYNSGQSWFHHEPKFCNPLVCTNMNLLKTCQLIHWYQAVCQIYGLNMGLRAKSVIPVIRQTVWLNILPLRIFCVIICLFYVFYLVEYHRLCIMFERLSTMTFISSICRTRAEVYFKSSGIF